MDKIKNYRDEGRGTRDEGRGTESSIIFRLPSFVLRLSSFVAVFCLLSSVFIGCAKPLIEGSVSATEPVSAEVSADPNTIYYAVRWAFEACGYPVGTEDLVGGVMESKWVPTKAASHYIELFGRKDYGVNAAYYKMVVKIVPKDAQISDVLVSTKVDSIVPNLKSNGDEERKLLEKIAAHARGHDVDVTNLGAMN